MSLDIEQSLNQARALAEAGKHDEARVLLLELLKTQPDNQAALLILGGEYFRAEKFSEAEMVFERLVLLDPGNGKYSIALFNSLWKQGRHEESLEEIKRFLSVADKVKERPTIEQYAKIAKEIAGSNRD